MTHEELREILNEEITQPHPDPSWDYYQLWEELRKARKRVEELHFFICKQEEATDNIDTLIRGKLFSLECDFEEMRKYVSQ